jgi:hypothetical protein
MVRQQLLHCRTQRETAFQPLPDQSRERRCLRIDSLRDTFRRRTPSADLAASPGRSIAVELWKTAVPAHQSRHASALPAVYRASIHPIWQEGTDLSSQRKICTKVPQISVWERRILKQAALVAGRGCETQRSAMDLAIF